MTLLMKLIGCSGTRCKPCIQTIPPAIINVQPAGVECAIPEGPKPTSLGSKRIVAGTWELKADRSKFIDTDGGHVVENSKMIELGLYLVDVRALIKAQKDCIDAFRAATTSTASPAAP